MTIIEKYNKYYRGLRYYYKESISEYFIFSDVFTSSTPVMIKVNTKNNVFHNYFYLSIMLEKIENGKIVVLKQDLRKRKLELLKK
jgi:hypothetical protein